MTPPNIDLAEICPELAKLCQDVEESSHDQHLEADDENYIGISLAEIQAIAATMLKLAEFAEYCLDQYSWDNEPDGGSIQDKAEELGFLELRPIDSEDSINGETEHYFCKWTPLAARKGDGDNGKTN